MGQALVLRRVTLLLCNACHPGPWGCIETFFAAHRRIGIPVHHVSGVVPLGQSSVRQSRLSAEIGTGTVSRVHIPDHDPGLSRLVKRLRIFGKVTPGKRSGDIGLVLPTPKRWKRLVLPGFGEHRDARDAPPHLFPRLGVG